MSVHSYRNTRCHIFSWYSSNSCFLWTSTRFEMLISKVVWSERLRLIYSGFGYHCDSYPTPTFPGTNPRWTGTKLLLQFSSLFKSSSTTAAGGCDVNGGEIVGYFPSPRANKCHAYSWICNVTGTMTRHTMCVQGRYGHSFALISVKYTAACVFPR
jgi:hypothetical protein